MEFPSFESQIDRSGVINKSVSCIFGYLKNTYLLLIHDCCSLQFSLAAKTVKKPEEIPVAFDILLEKSHDVYNVSTKNGTTSVECDRQKTPLPLNQRKCPVESRRSTTTDRICKTLCLAPEKMFGKRYNLIPNVL